MKQTRFSKSFQNRVMKCEYHMGTYWLDVRSSVSDKIYKVSVKIGDDCGWSGIQGIPNGLMCSHMICALRFLVDKSVVEGALKDKAITKVNLGG